ncbi:hypothetical protein SUGI_0423040 [Cryptomeria japonica]|uniref:subtilisin-like protease SBT3 n=1 Tax=Cryptomeria japonica TaxID=3369 RepID=UPI002408D392|nr:subtilisin-like protease SBT3 [Cryptomeria japonica]GLJ22466.1 hypothetical protein SUGI_0423040 [Cryptomeria japonica]
MGMRGEIVSACITVAAMIMAVCAGTEDAEKPYIVHMDKSQMPPTFLTHHHWYKSVMSSAMDVERHADMDRKLVYTYDHAMHGFGAMLTSAELEAVKKLPGYVESYEDTGSAKMVETKEFKQRWEWVPPSNERIRYGRRLQTTYSYKFLGLSEKEGLWPQSQFGDSNGVIVGIIDSGIWPESPSFVGDGMGPVPKKWKGICQRGEDWKANLCNRKLIGARYFNRGFVAQGHKLNEKDFNSTRDFYGHGTFIASVVGAQAFAGANVFGLGTGVAKGVAPHVRLAIYKVIWHDTTSSIEIITDLDIIRAMDQALADGVDIISISLGVASSDYKQNPVAISALKAAQDGVLVVAAASNDGPNPGTVKNDAPWLLTVGASTINRAFQARITLGDGLVIDGTSLYTPKFSTPKITFVNGNECAENTLDPFYITGNILFCHDSNDVSVATRVHVAKTTGAIAAIIAYNDALNLPLETYSMPVVFVNREQSHDIVKYFGLVHTPKASLQFVVTQLGYAPAPRLITNSGVGPAPIFPEILKPDLLGPGVDIIGACASPDRKSACFTIGSGTSIATPHVAGVAALLKAVHPDWSPAAIKSAMMTSARAIDNTGQLIASTDLSAPELSPLDYGCGSVSPQSASNPGLVYDMGYKDYVNYLCLTKRTSGTICRHENGSQYDLNLPSFTANFLASTRAGFKQVRSFKRVVTNFGGGGDGVYDSNAYMGPRINVTVTPKTLVFNQTYQKLSFTLQMELIGPVQVTDKVIDGVLLWSDATENGVDHEVYSPLVAVFPDNYNKG